MNEKVKTLVKSKKVMIAALSVLIVGGAVGTYVYQSNQKIEAAQKTLDSGGKTIQSIQKKAESLYSTKDPEFLKEGITDTQIKDVQKEFDATIKATNKKITKDQNVKIKQLKSTNYTKKLKECNALVNAALDKFTDQQAINALFQQSQEKVAMNGDKINKDLAVADDLTTKTVESVKKELLVAKSDATFEKITNELVSNAEGQLKQIDTAKQAVLKVFKENKVVSTDQKLFDSAKAESDKIKNEKAKKELLDQLNKVKADIDKKASEEKKKTEEAQKQEQNKVVEQNGSQQAQGNATNNNPSAGGNETNTGGGYPTGNATGGGTNQEWQGGGSGNTEGGGQPSNPSGGSSGGGSTGGGTTSPPPAEKTIIGGYVGNCGRTFKTWGEMVAFGNENKESNGGKYSGYIPITIFYSDGSEEYSCDLY